MTKSNQDGITRRNLIMSAVAAGIGLSLGGSLTACSRSTSSTRLSIPYSNKSLDYYFFVIQE